ncbi:MAG TPA: hypothetical protein DEB30_04535 [Candidatus Peribacter riflensis]|uniref:Uncharacterized protein n=1 Tax=Candidatus Peribacter riflensis TaxID=1735162 RepID=A0A0S1SLX8_9BACT|nr:MAG: hypothetical protein PeribacterA2_0861 [Candidatus Peribacter riflensis]OGJ77713.1 MAG: hypothetical protein A2398_04545 [Candidatus Peribacteria bacterium RIFOXYB1_FULL_57_12]OGJ79686.1 MAG: hypothetical protein A2412_01910 [Candidatus Peribacteria bacterium RIFOXYC1_FULL_58_8]ALM11327.1 MAG: hypothetical protein PeribacterB2_0863 [Candidatus Peribacter riflensis]ALM12429.1 MAG: hypothetical protein PeribacterC2_0862 [Candidatus Peribacter riflensis]
MTQIPAAIAEKLRAEVPLAPGPREVLRRVLFPFALFSVVLLSLLLLSWYLLLPRFTRVDLHGVPQDPSRLQAYAQEVRAAMRGMEDKRLALILPLDRSPYGALVQEKMSQPQFFALFEQFRNVAHTFLPEQPQAVVIQSMVWEKGAIILKGDVRNVGLQSMAVLAQFAKAVQAMPGVERSDFPTFSRERDETIGFHSPFMLRVIMR